MSILRNALRKKKATRKDKLRKLRAIILRKSGQDVYESTMRVLRALERERK